MVKNILKRGAGSARNYWAIKRWLNEEEVKLADIARYVAVGQYVVSNTIRGFSNNRLVLGRLLELGCPADILGLPRDMRSEVGVATQA